MQFFVILSLSHRVPFHRTRLCLFCIVSSFWVLVTLRSRMSFTSFRDLQHKYDVADTPTKLSVVNRSGAREKWTIMDGSLQGSRTCPHSGRESPIGVERHAISARYMRTLVFIRPGTEVSWDRDDLRPSFEPVDLEIGWCVQGLTPDPWYPIVVICIHS